MDSQSLTEVIVVLEADGELHTLGTLHNERPSVCFELDPGALARPILLGPDIGQFLGRQWPEHKSGMFGAFSDSSPDRWGRLLMKRRQSLEDSGAQTLTEWDYLLQVQDATRQGAIRFIDPASGEFIDNSPNPIPPMTRIRELETAALSLQNAILEGDIDAIRQWTRILVAPGSSLGGARPKANVTNMEGQLCVAKFPARDDDYDVGLWERIYAQLAGDAGINVSPSETQRFSSRHHTFLSLRFDREGQRRRHFMSAMTLAGKTDGDDASYLDILQALDDYGDPDTIEADRVQLYRRMIFNVMAGNRDDHLRNHGFLVGSQGVKLSPAYDMNPTPDKLEHAITIDGHSAEPNMQRVLEVAGMFGIKGSEATGIIDDVRMVLRAWREVAERMQANAADTYLIAPALSCLDD